MAAASSDIYDFFSEELTIEKGNFDSFLFGVDGSFAVASRIDLVAAFEISRASVSSEYRDFVDENDLPILQDTRLTVVPATLSVKLYLTPRGREVSRYAFVPAKIRPYAGGGGGFVWYELEAGDFVDFVDLTIFTSGLRSSGWGFASQAFGGVEVLAVATEFPPPDFRTHQSADPLKRRGQGVRGSRAARFPCLPERGPVEAVLPLFVLFGQQIFPRSSECGPIEARNSRRDCPRAAG